ncbi:OLC1v1024520C1 [Oldenlandia corymbosa var. corymbosa]|uniref:OLC1v1024520C1 n=1 Tax=Oldenlandia corymbosa var. corymbosa TaxID=529605 RepID=A0AAV1C3G3_OLDCO|nr:OLC1v1024520C1 [Oldenlandia corymbosa var. corymbosa]
MGKRSAFDDSDEEEQYPEERPQGTPQPEMGQEPPSQMTRAHAESLRKRNPSGQTSGQQKRKRRDPEVVEVDPLSFSLPAIHELSSIDELLKEGYADQGRGAELFEDVPAGHVLLTFDPPRVECADLPDAGVPRLEDGMRQAVQAVNSFVTVCADLEGQLFFSQAEGHRRGQQGQRGGDVAPGLRRGERAPGRGEKSSNGEFAGYKRPQISPGSVHPSGGPEVPGVVRVRPRDKRRHGPRHRKGARKVVLEIEAAQRKNEDIQPILDKYADREMKEKTSAVRLRCKARKHFRDMDFVHLPIMQQIARTCPSVSKPEDILDIPGNPSFVFQMPRGTQTPPSMPPRPDEEPKIVASVPPPQGHNSESRGGGGTSTDSNAHSGDKVNDA